MKTFAVLLVVIFFVSDHTQSPPKVRIYAEDVENLIYPPLKVDLNSLYVERLMLRFTEPWTQIVIVSRIDGVDLRQYTVDSKPGVDELFQRANNGDTSITAEQIASQIHVSERHIPVSRQQVGTWFKELKTMKFSPILDDAICLHGCPYFELWFDSRQDSVHYSMAYAPSIPSQKTTQALLAEWMLKVRLEVNKKQK
jgi:hypothetical protein